jgi:uncharacterized repeat protein (TIGR03803 family)
MNNFWKLPLVFILIFSSPFQSYAQAKLWGMTSMGGSNNSGVIFNTDANGANPQNQFSFFNGSRGSSPTGGLTLYSNSKLYGMTVGDGANFGGVLFEYDPATSVYTVKFDFSFTNAATTGRNPSGSLTLSNNGKMYGTTRFGGKHDLGVLFEYDPITNKLTKRLDFERTVNGSYPCDLTASSEGKLYGLTRSGGAKGHGVLFEFNPNNNTFVKKIDFDGKGNGSSPTGSLTFGNNGKLYGVTAFGGANGYDFGTFGYGVLFEYDPIAGTLSKRVDFDLTSHGAYPMASLTLGINEKLYGTTYSGGLNLVGVLFEFDPSSNQFTKMIDFEATKTGGAPLGGLLAYKDGILIGTTNTGGSSSNGVLFEFNSATGVLVKRFDFDDKENGAYPNGNLTFGNNGRVYGATQFGGTNLAGVIFEYDALLKSMTKKIDFGNFNGGKNPVGNLYQGKGKLFGLSKFGGDNESGTLFEIDLVEGAITKKIDFDGINNGQYPTGSLVSGHNGKLYSTTSSGGTKLAGVLFEYDTSLNKLIKKIDFDTISGLRPIGDLIVGSNNKLYGTTAEGGENSYGTLFEYDSYNSKLTKKIDFDGKDKGAFPSGNMVISANGKLYGMTTYGGIYNQGVIFEYDISTNMYSKKIDLDSTSNGALPYGGLVLTKDGKMYGMTTLGGTRNFGILFEYSLETDSFIKKVDFDGITTGAYPIGNLTLSSNGNLYGMASAGGVSNLGVLYEFNPTSDMFSKKFDFNGSNGSRPLGGLLLVKDTPEVAWNNPADIPYGTPLSSSQLNAISNIPGSFVYNPAPGTVLNAGSHNLSATFTPLNLINYTIATKNVTININKANQQITFAAISDKQFGDASFTFISPTSTSDLSVTVTHNTRVTISENQVTMVSAGKASMNASQSGNDNYNAAATVVREFCIKPTKPSVTVSLTSGIAILTSGEVIGNQWYLNGAMIPGATNATYTATDAGTYKVQVSIDDCVSDFSNDTPVVITGDLPTGKPSIALYPNPTTGNMFIVGLEPETKECSVVDLLGRSVKMTLEKVGEEQRLTTEGMVEGIYLLRVEQKNSVQRLRFIKKN